MTAAGVDTDRTQKLGTLLVRAFDPDLTIGELVVLVEDIARKLTIKLPTVDKIMVTLRRLPKDTNMATDLLPLPRGLDLTDEEAGFFADIVADLILTAIPSAKNLFSAHHQGDEQGVRDQLAILNEYRTKVTETMTFEDDTYVRRRVALMEELAPEHGGGQFMLLAPILALLVAEFLLAGGVGYLRPCAFCGNLFLAARSDAQYCTDSCRAKMSKRNRGL